MSTNITASPEEPSNSLTVPSVGEDVDAWGATLNEQTFVTLLAYILWLKENTGGSPAAEEVTYDNDTSGLTAEDVQAALDELADTALQPGDELTALAATGITAGYVPKSDGEGGIVWAEEAGGGGGGGGIDPSDGLVVVQHGAVAATARPTAGVVYWMGSVAPDNKQTGDLWLETGAFD